VLYFDSLTNEFIKSLSPHHLHHRANVIGSGKAPEDHHFFHQVITAVADVAEILVVGPGFAKGQLFKYALTHDPEIAQRIIGVETVDHPTDPQVIAYAKKYFERADLMRAI
jgi:stalled ribosome rescue protein Dom34